MAPAIPPKAFSRGDFVRSNFPFGGLPDIPGPSEHIAYIAAVTWDSDSKRHVVPAFYTTSSIPTNQPRPAGAIDIDEKASRAMGMRKPFRLDIRTAALIPITERYFPKLETPGRGIVGHASRHLQGAIERTAHRISGGGLIQLRIDRSILATPIRARQMIAAFARAVQAGGRER